MSLGMWPSCIHVHVVILAQGLLGSRLTSVLAVARGRSSHAASSCSLDTANPWKLSSACGQGLTGSHSGPQGPAIRTRIANLFFRFESPCCFGAVRINLQSIINQSMISQSIINQSIINQSINHDDWARARGPGPRVQGAGARGPIPGPGPRARGPIPGPGPLRLGPLGPGPGRGPNHVD